MANVKTFTQMYHELTDHFKGQINLTEFKRQVTIALRSYRIAIKSSSRTAKERQTLFSNAQMMLDVAHCVVTNKIK